ncbi:hypothetical protein Mapa_010672 [Marchantia paleacea]|nr:hypothetical protein Mapa_010672 [Marchantia paleacea]
MQVSVLHLPNLKDNCSSKFLISIPVSDAFLDPPCLQLDGFLMHGRNYCDRKCQRISILQA